MFLFFNLLKKKKLAIVLEQVFFVILVTIATDTLNNTILIYTD
jgi:hypothetical protein